MDGQDNEVPTCLSQWRPVFQAVTNAYAKYRNTPKMKNSLLYYFLQNNMNAVADIMMHEKYSTYFKYVLIVI